MDYSTVKKRPKAKVQHRLQKGSYHTWAGNVSVNWVCMKKTEKIIDLIRYNAWLFVIGQCAEGYSRIFFLIT